MSKKEGFRNDLPADELIQYYTDLYKKQTIENPFFSIPIPDETATKSTTPKSGYIIEKEETTADGFVIKRGQSYGKPFVTLSQYIGSDENVTIPDDVTEISRNCFSGSNLKKVIIPECIKEISYSCFSPEALESIADQNGFCIVGQHLIKYLGSDSVVIIPDGVTVIAESAFEKQEAMTTVHIPQSVRVIGKESFCHCENLSSVIFDEKSTGLESIEESAFACCSNLTSINIPGPVGHIGGKAFGWCNPSVDNNGFETIGNVLVKYSGSETKVTIPDGIRIIGPSAFLQSQTVKVVVPEGVEVISTSAFHASMALTEVFLPTSLKTIDDNAFIACRKLSLVNPENAVRIGDSAFKSCVSLTEITLSGNLKSIGNSAFEGCSDLSKVNISKDGQIIQNMLPDGLTSIPFHLFYNCSSLQSLSVPGTVKSIGFEAFFDCSKLSQLVISEGTQEIGVRSFFRTSALSALTLPSTIESIGENAFRFSACSKDIILPKALEDNKFFYGIPDKNGCFVDNGILKGYFAGNSQTITISDGVVIIAEGSLPLGWGFGTVNVSQINLPDTVRVIQQKDFGYSLQFKMNIPCGYLLQKSKLPSEPLKVLLESVWKDEASMLDWISVYLFQNSKPLKDLCKNAFSSAPNEYAAACLALLRVDCKSGEIDRSAEIVYDLRQKISQELLDRFYLFAKERKAKKTVSMLEPFASSANGDNTKEEKKYQSKLDEFCDKNFAKHEFERVMKRAGLKDALFEKSGVKYADSGKNVPAFILECAIIPYIGQMTERPKHISDYKSYFCQFKFMTKSDEVASNFENVSFVTFLDKLAKQANRYEKVQIWLPVCRYGNSDQMKALISDLRAWSDWYECGVSGRSGIMVASGAIMLSETREAMLFAEKRGDLDYYAKIRGTTAETIRDTKLADFGFDKNGKKVYDIGSTVIEAYIGNDLSVTLFDTKAGKIVKSLPKKNADQAKYDSCSTDYAELKKNVKKVVKSRNDLLFDYFLTGKTMNASAWIDAYTGNPVLNKVARLLVWTQKDKTFTLSDSGTIDSNGNNYEIDRSGKISVAHPQEMKDEDIMRWQKYFVSGQLKQPFEQIWEPKIDSSSIKSDRYKGCMIPYYRFLHQEKHGITVYDSDFHNDISIYLDGLDASINRVDWARHSIDVNDRFEITSIKVGKLSRKTNHLIFYLDKCTAYARIANDDDSVLDSLRGYTAAQIEAFLKYAIENKCTKCTAGLLEFKNKYFAEFAEVDEFTLD